VSDETVTIEAPTSEVTSGFRRAADSSIENETDGDSAGFVLQQEAADKTRQEREDGKGPSAGFKKASDGKGDNGFRISGSDSEGNGFTLPPDTSGGIHSGKWSAFQPKWFITDNHTLHFARQLNPRFDRIIKRALDHNWEVLGVEMGIAGRVEGNPVLVRALNRRMQELAMGGKSADSALHAMGYRPEKVRHQLQNMKAYSGHIDDVLEALKPAAPPPASMPAGPAATPS
jgi:hypothetical protein